MMLSLIIQNKCYTKFIDLQHKVDCQILSLLYGVTRIHAHLDTWIGKINLLYLVKFIDQFILLLQAQLILLYVGLRLGPNEWFNPSTPTLILFLLLDQWLAIFLSFCVGHNHLLCGQFSLNLDDVFIKFGLIIKLFVIALKPHCRRVRIFRKVLTDPLVEKLIRIQNGKWLHLSGPFLGKIACDNLFFLFIVIHNSPDCILKVFDSVAFDR